MGAERRKPEWFFPEPRHQQKQVRLLAEKIPFRVIENSGIHRRKTAVKHGFGFKTGRKLPRPVAVFGRPAARIRGRCKRRIHQKHNRMLSLGSSTRYFLCREVVDFRKSFDGLSGVVRDSMRREVTSGEAFIFVNRRRDSVKILVWDRTGFVLWYKRLEAGTFELPTAS